MRPSFGEALSRYNETIHEFSMDEPADDQYLLMANEAIEYELERAATIRGNTVDVQKQIFDIQKQKRDVMDHLHEQLRAIDQKGSRGENKPHQEREETQARKVIAKDGKLFVVHDQMDNALEQLTVGELLTDGDWGLCYALDEMVPRAIKKRFVVENAKRELRHLLNQQIVRDEASSSETDSAKKRVYEEFGAKNLDKGVESWAGGHIAELMIENLLRKLCIDSGSDMEVFPVDFHDDMELKIDFIIQRKVEKRGVRVEGIEDTGETERIGIQFTIEDRSNILEHKLKQINSAKGRLLAKKTIVKDIILVAVPLKNIRQKLDYWSKNGKPTGGPDRQWASVTKHRIVHEVLKGLVDEQEIEQMFARSEESRG